MMFIDALGVLKQIFSKHNIVILNDFDPPVNDVKTGELFASLRVPSRSFAFFAVQPVLHG